MENNVGDMYLYDVTVDRRTRYKYNEPGHNIYMLCHIEEEKNADWSDLINIRVFKSISRNAIKRLKIRQETCELTRNAIKITATLKQEVFRSSKSKKKW